MTMKTFTDYGDLTHAIRAEVQVQLETLDWAGDEIVISRDSSNQSCSAYLSIWWSRGDFDSDTVKLRISDHGDRYGSDYTVSIGRAAVGIYEGEAGEETTEKTSAYLRTEIKVDDFASLIAEGVAAVKRLHATAMADA